MPEGADLTDVVIRLLEPHEAERLTDAIRAAYGETYDAEWVYDPHEIRARISEGRLVSCIAERDGELLCHAGLTFHHPSDAVGHLGQAVTVPAARGHHLFTQVKRHLADLARRNGLFGIYSEATAAHPYSQRANVELGAQETGFLLGWIPGTVANDAALRDRRGRRRQSAVLFYLRTNPGPSRPVYAPDRHHEVIRSTIETTGLHGRIAQPPRDIRLQRRSTIHTHVQADHNFGIATVREPGADLGAALASVRDRLFHGGLDALYVDLPLNHHGTAVASDELSSAGLAYSGIFPNTLEHGDVLRLQALNGVTVSAHDVAVASEHGRGLLGYVLADLAATGQETNDRSRSSTSAAPSSAGPPRRGCAPARERSTT